MYPSHSHFYTRATVSRQIASSSLVGITATFTKCEIKQGDMVLVAMCDTAEDLYSRYGQDNVEQSIMLDRVTQLILENAVIEEVSADEEASADNEEGAEEE